MILKYYLLRNPDYDPEVFPNCEPSYFSFKLSENISLLGNADYDTPAFPSDHLYCFAAKYFQSLSIKLVWRSVEFTIPEMQIKKERTSCVMRIRFPCIHHGLARADDSDIAE